MLTVDLQPGDRVLYPTADYIDWLIVFISDNRAQVTLVPVLTGDEPYDGVIQLNEHDGPDHVPAFHFNRMRRVIGSLYPARAVPGRSTIIDLASSGPVVYLSTVTNESLERVRNSSNSRPA